MRADQEEPAWIAAPSAWLRLAEIDSTNAFLLRQAESLPSGTVMIADAQTAGRGRLGRTWVSPPGTNLYTSLLLRRPELADGLETLPLVAALAICDTAREWGVHAAWVKWPNDVWVEQRKLAGVLTESRWQGRQLQAVVIGMGVNLNMQGEQLEAIARPATSIRRETAAEVDREAFCQRLYQLLREGLSLVAHGGFDRLYPRWRAASRLVGRSVTLAWGDQTREGIVRDLLPDGSLLLEHGDGSQARYRSGEVSLGMVTPESGI